jgi:hypothetical protein
MVDNTDCHPACTNEPTISEPLRLPGFQGFNHTGFCAENTKNHGDRNKQGLSGN